MKQRKNMNLHKFLSVFLMLLVVGCTGGEKDKGSDIIVRIDDESITLKEFNETFSAEGSRYTSLNPKDKKQSLVAN